MTARIRRKCRKRLAKTNFRKQTVERFYKMLRVTTKNVEKCQAIKRWKYETIEKVKNTFWKSQNCRKNFKV